MIKEKLSNLGFFSNKLLEYKAQTQKTFSISPRKPLKILRIICQRPYFTGSGINLINLTKLSIKEGIDQFIIFGQPTSKSNPFEGIIDSDKTLTVNFNNEESPDLEEIPFSVAGMSDQMPYPSTKFSDFNEEMLESYLEVFAKKINIAVEKFNPNIIHSHHLWLVTALSRVLYQDILIVATCHNTALRQLFLANHLKDFVIEPVKDLDAIAVLNEDQKNRVKDIYGFDNSSVLDQQIRIVGTGINTELFYPPPNKEEKTKKLIYVGKLSFSKGLPQLIQAFNQLVQNPDFKYNLVIVGSGDGKEKDEIIQMGNDINKRIHFLGQLNQIKLANHFREAEIFILPSFYDGFPKVLIESLACGCKALMTDLPGIQESLTKSSGETKNVIYLPLPRMKSIDVPRQEDLPAFIENLKQAITFQIEKVKEDPIDIEYSEKIRENYGWNMLYKKYLNIYYSLLND